jgi:formylglycine-generating enzyme required for sulfatase activity/mono/diheme cytochrome c family protein
VNFDGPTESIIGPPQVRGLIPDSGFGSVVGINRMVKHSLAVLSASVLLLSGGRTFAAEPTADPFPHAKAVLESSCISCHGGEHDKGKLKLDTMAAILKGGENGTAVVPGDPAKSPLYTLTQLPKGHDDIMPPKGEPLSKEQADALKNWIVAGAKMPEGATLAAVRRIDFVKDVQPILEIRCVACHREAKVEGKLRLDVKSEAMSHEDAIVPFDSKKSLVYTSTTLLEDDENLMPPAKKGGPISTDEIETLKLWIDQGAVWPEIEPLLPRKASEATSDENAKTAEIYRLVASKPGPATEAEMGSYTNTIPGTVVKYVMVPIRGGEVLMGSPATEPGRGDDENPRIKVKIDPFWMEQCEITWNEFEAFMYPEEERKYRDTLKTEAYIDKVSDAVSRPTKPYVEMSFGMGKDGYPAISMTQHAARKYCQWLSAKTGQFYRLPTEAEWEYACRAGTTTAYSWGDDPAKAKDYAWFEKDSDYKYQKVGKKLPNPWGLYDMHGNVAEWVLDQYSPTYDTLKAVTGENPYVLSTTPYPHSVRGGSWDDPITALRSAARKHSDKNWKQQDPQLPKSIWYLTDAQFLGFRIVRPLKVPTQDEMHRYWNSGVQKE